MLEAIAHETRHILFYPDRRFAERSHELDRLLSDFRVGGVGTDDLHERNEMRRHEEVHAQYAAAVLEVFCDLADRKVGRVARERNIGPDESLELRKKPLLERKVFRRGLDDE